MDNDQKKNWIRYAYPLTIVSDRYSGTYSDGKFTAWPLYPDQLPNGYDGSDCHCADFWSDYTDYVGKGDTPQEAYKNLLKQYDE